MAKVIQMKRGDGEIFHCVEESPLHNFMLGQGFELVEAETAEAELEVAESEAAEAELEVAESEAAEAELEVAESEAAEAELEVAESEAAETKPETPKVKPKTKAK